MKPNFNPSNLNNCYLTFFIPIKGEQEVVKIRCASFRYVKEGAKDLTPYISVKFDWEDENRTGAPNGVKEALIAFEYMHFKDSPFNTLKVQQYCPNGIIITGFEDMNYRVDTPSPNPGI